MSFQHITRKMLNTTVWRSGHAIAFLLIIFVALISITPPMQSPDEFDHIKRAYALGEGTIFFKPQGNQSSGAMIDDGLLKYIAFHDPLGLNPNQKVTTKNISAAGELRWEGTKTFSATPATAFYFPLIYAPQAFALQVGKWLGLSIHRSYYLTRFVAAITVLSILTAAFTLISPSPVALALLAMPMSVYQLSSTSLDGIATALSVLFISIFLKLLRDPLGGNRRLFWVALVSFGLLASSRLQLLPFFLAFLVLFVRDKNKVHLISSFAVLCLVCFWVLLAGKYTVDHRVPSNIGSSEVALFYIRHPISLFQVIWSTLTDRATLLGYFSSFFGILGWLNAAFQGKAYIYLLIGMLAISVASLSFKYIKLNWPVSVLFILIASISMFLIMFAMLTTWTPYPSDTIIGVQGRYFLIPALVLSYGLFPSISTLSQKRLLPVLVLLSGFALYSLYITINLLLTRYYTQVT